MNYFDKQIDRNKDKIVNKYINRIKMNTKDKIAENINDLLPDSSSLLGTDGLETRQSLVNKKAENIHERKSARELARARFVLRSNQEAKIATDAVEAYKEQKEQS